MREDLPALEVSDIVKVYNKAGLKDRALTTLLGRETPKEVRAVDGVSLRVEWGEIFGILGPNGAGKTTLIKIITTVLRQTSGIAKVAGFDTIEQSLEVRKRIGVLPEDSERGFYWRLSVWDNLYFYTIVYEVGNPAERVEQLIKMFELEEHADKGFQKLSRGEKQRVGVARALISDAPILILDEPTLGLDVKTSKTMRTWLKERFDSKDRTIFLSSHDMRLVDEVCERVAIIHKGKILSIGSPSEVKSLIARGQKARFAIQVESITNELKRKITDMGWDVKEEYEKLIVTAPDSNPGEEEIRHIVAIASEGGRLKAFQELEPSLEETFIALTEGGA